MTPEESRSVEIREALNTAADVFEGLGEEMNGDIHPVLAQRAAVACRVAIETGCPIDSLLSAADSLLISAGGLYVSAGSGNRLKATRLYELALSWRRLCIPGYDVQYDGQPMRAAFGLPEDGEGEGDAQA
jgi:hypothetical protein